MKFSQEMTAGVLLRKRIREMLNNTKQELEFTYPECSVLVTEDKSFLESHFKIIGKNLPDSAAPAIRRWFNQLKQLED